jgi:DNA-binding transcriptional regulator PaaX
MEDRDWRVLDYLAKHGGEISVGTLSEVMMRSTISLRGSLQRLQKQSYAQCMRIGRAATWSVTAAGKDNLLREKPKRRYG